MTDDRRRLISALEIVTGVGILLFWIAFFTVGMAPENPPPGYFAYEHSFPLPDGLMCILLIAAGILLMKNRRAGMILSLIGAGALIFLGLLDFSFNLQNGVYAASVLDMVINGLINAWCVGFGLFMSIVVGKALK
ncbi:MAG: hypothetical protein JW901_00590 [Dehalococcoidia bacterium]|nr:hypothetical protein [Dehalococcoidia bacterium]